MSNDCQVTTAELDQKGTSTYIAYRHDHGRMATLAINGAISVFAPEDIEQQWELLCQTQLQEPIQVRHLPSCEDSPMSCSAMSFARMTGM